MSFEDDLKRLGEATEEELEKAMKLDAALRQHAEEAGTVNAWAASIEAKSRREEAEKSIEAAHFDLLKHSKVAVEEGFDPGGMRVGARRLGRTRPRLWSSPNAWRPTGAMRLRASKRRPLTWMASRGRSQERERQRQRALLQKKPLALLGPTKWQGQVTLA